MFSFYLFGQDMAEAVVQVKVNIDTASIYPPRKKPEKHRGSETVLADCTSPQEEKPVLTHMALLKCEGAVHKTTIWKVCRM